MENNNWRVDINYSCFVDAVKTIRSVAGASKNRTVCIALKKTGYLVMAVESPMTDCIVGCRISSHRSMGVKEDENVAVFVPLPFVSDLSRKIGKKKNSYGYLTLKVEGQKITGILEDNMFRDNIEDSAVLKPADEVFSNMLEEKNEWDKSSYSAIAEGSAERLQHSLNVALLGTETDKTKILSVPESKIEKGFAYNVFMAVDKSRMRLSGTNNEKMAVSELRSNDRISMYKFLGAEGQSLENITLSSKRAVMLMRVLDTDKGTKRSSMFEMLYNGKYLLTYVKSEEFSSDRSRFILLPLIEGARTPKWDNVIPADTVSGRTVVTVDASSLLKAIGSVKHVAVEAPYKHVAVEIKENVEGYVMKLSSGYCNVKAVAQDIKADVIKYDKYGEPMKGVEISMKVLLNVDYLMDSILQLIDRNGNVSLSLNSNILPVFIFNNSDTFLIMPIYIKEEM